MATVAKDYQVVKGNEDGGFFKLYVNKAKHRVLAEIPNSLQGKPFLLATSITGGEYTGWQWNDLYVYWERFDRRLVLVEPEIRYKAGNGTIAEVVKRTYRDKVITAVPIIAEGPGGAAVIDLTSLFGGRASIFVGSVVSGIDSSLTKLSKAKVFPNNVEIELDFAKMRGSSSFSFMRGSGSGVAVHYSVSRLPATGYRPRLADDRIGYFLTVHKDFGKGPNTDTNFVRYINRWHLEKADASLALSPPKKPIIFYIEKTVPIRYRRYVKAGILEWNKAFEKIGIIDAVQVRQQTATEFKDLDPEDVSYNFFRWIASESAFAMGPSRVHPETGQILDADIIFDESMIHSWFKEYAGLIKKGPVKEFHPGVARFLEENPHRHPMRRWLERRAPGEREPYSDGRRTPEKYGHVAAASDAENYSPDAKARKRAFRCDYGGGKRHQVNFGLTVLEAMVSDPSLKRPLAKSWNDEFIGEVLKEVVMHEVGHTLGLRHNFKASTWLDLNKINEGGSELQATTGSVMDYNPTNISPRGTSQGPWQTRTLGPYDFWAIEYGYTLKGSEKDLAKITIRGAEKGLAYATDEDIGSSDPYVYRFDMGSDPIEYSRRRMELAQQTIRRLLSQVKAGEGYQKVRSGFDMLLFDYAQSSWRVAKFLGGHSLHRDHKGDPGERPPIQPVPAAKQREALELLCEKMFRSESFQFSPELINHLAVGRWDHWGARSSSAFEYDIHDRILQIQLWSLFDILNYRTLTLIADTELRSKDSEDIITIPEVLTSVSKAIFSELLDEERTGSAKKYTNRSPLIDSLRRNLQNEYVNELIELAMEDTYGSSPHAARTQAAYHLGKIKSHIEVLLKKDGLAIDDYSLAHLQETRRKIEKALDANYTRGGGGGGGGSLFLFGREAR